MTWGAYGAQQPPSGGLGRHHASENDISVIHVPAGQGTYSAADEGRPQQDSNLRSRLRRPLLSPLSYGGCATPKSTSRKPREHVVGHENGARRPVLARPVPDNVSG